MISYTLRSKGLSPEAALKSWTNHRFFKTSVVLGIDIGLRGIGVCVRKGPEIVYAKTWMIDLPPSKALADRRAKRAWRHCRENRRTRLKRLQMLFKKHGLPWLNEDSDAMRRTDPFLLRHRALESKLASREALSIVIRHIVSHRGYDYQYFNEEGAYPWGDTTDFKKVMPELQSLWLEAADATRVLQDAEGFGWNDSDLAAFETLVRARTIAPERDPIRARLARHATQKRTHIRPRAKGEAFPRALVWSHLIDIIDRHRDLIDDVDSFVAALAVKPQEKKSQSIFFYHRKTPEEMRKHFEKKVRKCRYAPWLGLADEERCAERGDRDVSRFLLLEFLASRRLELNDGARTLVHLSSVTIDALLKWHNAHEDAFAARSPLPKWLEAKKIIATALKKDGLGKTTPETRSDFNKSYFSTLKDLIAPTIANRNQRASLSGIAAKKLFEIATADGLDPAAVREALRTRGYYDEKRAASVDDIGRYPQVEFLLGRRSRKDRKPTKKHPHRKAAGELAVEGRLHQLFRDLAPTLGSDRPDYCVIEVVGDAPRSEAKAKEIEQEIEKRRKSRDDIFERLGVEDTGSRTRRLRLKLYEQQNKRSPYTGTSLGDDPLSPDLEIEHMFPESLGGLWVNENLVLAPKSENRTKGQRTPRQAAKDLAGSWDAMLSHSQDMRWGAKKKAIFQWEDDTVPDFGNTTRTSQMARQLYAEIGRWLGIEAISDSTEKENTRAERIATPAGYLTATARAAWKMPRKDRQDLAHHLVDAVTLTHIPPREGMNSVACGGIFHTQWQASEQKHRLTVLPVGPDPAVIEPLIAPDAENCAIMHFRSSGSRASRHDQTLLSVDPSGRLVYHKPIDRASYGKDPHALSADLLASGIKPADLPSAASLEAWLLADDEEPLRLSSGSPVRRIRVINPKDSFVPPFGLSAQTNSTGGWQAVKIINSGKYAGATLMRRWSPPKGKRQGTWKFYVQRIPDRHAMESLLRLGFRWLAHAVEMDLPFANDRYAEALTEERLTLTERPRRWGYLTLPHIARRTLRHLVLAGFLGEAPGTAEDWAPIEKSIWGADTQPGDLPVIDPSTGKPCLLRRGDTFKLRVTPEGKRPASGAAYVERWFQVSSIKSDGSIKFKMVHSASRTDIGLTASDLAALFNSLATDDSPPDPIARGPVDPPSAGEADFRLQPDRD